MNKLLRKSYQLLNKLWTTLKLLKRQSKMLSIFWRTFFPLLKTSKNLSKFSLFALSITSLVPVLYVCLLILCSMIDWFLSKPQVYLLKRFFKKYFAFHWIFQVPKEKDKHCNVDYLANCIPFSYNYYNHLISTCPSLLWCIQPFWRDILQI